MKPELFNKLSVRKHLSRIGNFFRAFERKAMFIHGFVCVLMRSDVISDINWSSPQIVYDIFIRSEIRSYLQLLQDEINWI